MAIKECVICGVLFSQSSSSSKTCSKEHSKMLRLQNCALYRRKKYAENPELYIERTKAWAKDKREYLAEKARERRNANQEKCCAVNEAKKIARAADPEKYRERDAKYRKNRDPQRHSEINSISYFRRQRQIAQANLAITIAIQTGELK